LAAKAGARKPDGRPVWGAKDHQHTLVPLKRMLRDAVEDEYLIANPAASVRPLPYHPPEREILTPEQLRRITTSVGKRLVTLITTAAFTDVRRGELLGLRWGDLELGQGRLFVRQTYTQHGFGTPKSRAGRRVVPLTTALIAELRATRCASLRTSMTWCSPRTPARPSTPGTSRSRVGTGAPQGRCPAPAVPLPAPYGGLAADRPRAPESQAAAIRDRARLDHPQYGHLLPDSFEGFGAGLGAALAPRGDTAGGTAANPAIEPLTGATKKPRVCGAFREAPRVGLEPTTLRLTAGCSTIELPRNA